MVAMVSTVLISNYFTYRNWEKITRLECSTWDAYNKSMDFVCGNKLLENCVAVENGLNTQIQECTCEIENNTLAKVQKICTRLVDVYELKNWYSYDNINNGGEEEYEKDIAV